jgi:hypothetical protein
VSATPGIGQGAAQAFCAAMARGQRAPSAGRRVRAFWDLTVLAHERESLGQQRAGAAPGAGLDAYLADRMHGLY